MPPKKKPDITSEVLLVVNDEKTNDKMGYELRVVQYTISQPNEVGEQGVVNEPILEKRIYFNTKKGKFYGRGRAGLTLLDLKKIFEMKDTLVELLK